MHGTAMNITGDSGGEIALRARADAAAYEAAATRASVDMLLIELRDARAEVRRSRAVLEAIRRCAVSALPHARDERTALALGDIAVRAATPCAPVSLHAVRLA